jgi:hypothetical protein
MLFSSRPTRPSSWSFKRSVATGRRVMYLKALDGAEPLVPEGNDREPGRYTQRNDDIDAKDVWGSRVDHAKRMDLTAVEGVTDLDGAPVAAENDLVKITLHNEDGLVGVFLNVYAIEAENKAGTKVEPIVLARGTPPETDRKRVRIYSDAQKTTELTLPYNVHTEGPKEIWLEGRKGGRYRLVIFKTGDIDAARKAKSKEGGPTGIIFPVKCYNHAKINVVVVDLFQKAHREHVFDYLYHGTPEMHARLWPTGGSYLLGTNNLPGMAPGGATTIAIIKAVVDMGIGVGTSYGDPVVGTAVPYVTVHPPAGRQHFSRSWARM